MIWTTHYLEDLASWVKGLAMQSSHHVWNLRGTLIQVYICPKKITLITTQIEESISFKKTLWERSKGSVYVTTLSAKFQIRLLKRTRARWVKLLEKLNLLVNRSKGRVGRQASSNNVAIYSTVSTTWDKVLMTIQLEVEFRRHIHSYITGFPCKIIHMQTNKITIMRTCISSPIKTIIANNNNRTINKCHGCNQTPFKTPRFKSLNKWIGSHSIRWWYHNKLSLQCRTSRACMRSWTSLILDIFKHHHHRAMVFNNSQHFKAKTFIIHYRAQNRIRSNMFTKET